MALHHLQTQTRVDSHRLQVFPQVQAHHSQALLGYEKIHIFGSKTYDHFYFLFYLCYQN